MGDWLTHYEWIECTEGRERVAKALRRSCVDLDLGNDRWAVRARRLAPKLLQIETVKKWGQFDVVDALCRRMPSCRRLTPQFNFLLCLHGEPQLELDGAVRLLGECAKPMRLSQHSMLCLADSVPIAADQSPLDLEQEQWLDSPLFRVLDSLARGVPALTSARTDFLFGFFSPPHGYVHMGMLELSLTEPPWPGFAHVELFVSGQHNKAPVEADVGPSCWALNEPAETIPIMRALDWPFR